MIYKLGESLYSRDNFQIFENGYFKIKLKKGDVVTVNKIREKLKFSIQIITNEKICNFTPDEIKLKFFTQAEWRESQINSILE